jgi:pimeloyl-ACP methyl ester carboxylesterase
MPDGPLSVEAMADDTAGVLRALEIASAHVAGFSGRSIIAQELALRHTELVRRTAASTTPEGPPPRGPLACRHVAVGFVAATRQVRRRRHRGR